METLKILFFCSILLAAYSYAIYPMLLAVMAGAFGKKPSPECSTPKVTIVISAFNEERVIGRKIENSLALDYPEGMLEILVVSDRSTDRTDEIVGGYGSRGVRLHVQPVRAGKTAGLNEAVKIATGEVIIFTDADAIFEKDAVRRIAEALSDPAVGLVTGSTAYVSGGDEQVAETSGAYTRLERFIKIKESLLGSCVGADGAIFAVKKSLYIPLRSDDINDLVIPLNVVRQGQRVVFDEGLVCMEAASSDPGREFSRQIRITNRTLRAIFRNADLMNFLRHPVFAFELISHKLIRLSVPFFLIGALVTNAALAASNGLAFKVMLLIQGAFYLAALIGYLQNKSEKKSRVPGLVYHFVIINMSIFMGWVKFAARQNQVVWTPGSQ